MTASILSKKQREEIQKEAYICDWTNWTKCFEKVADLTEAATIAAYSKEIEKETWLNATASGLIKIVEDRVRRETIEEVVKEIDSLYKPKEDATPYTGEYAMGVNEVLDKLKSRITKGGKV